MSDRYDEERAMREVLWYFAPQAAGAWEPGSFFNGLINAMCLADHINLSKLTLVFPVYGTWVWRAKNTDGGLDELKAEVKSFEDREGNARAESRAVRAAAD